MTESVLYSDCCGWPVLTEERTLSGDLCSRCGEHCGLATAENAYWLAGDRNAAEYLYLHGPSRRYTVVRVDSEVGELEYDVVLRGLSPRTTTQAPTALKGGPSFQLES